MPAGILTQDLVAVCLLLVEGNLDATLEEVIRRADEFQEKRDRHFGISRSDLRGLFQYWTTFDMAIREYSETLDDIKLRDVINPMLDCLCAYFNDEGEYMDKISEEYSSWIGSSFDVDEEAYQEKLAIKRQMEKFFKDIELNSISGNDAMRFLDKMNISDSILYQCSRPGDSS